MNQGPTCSYVKFLRGVLNTKHVIEMQNYFFCFVVFFFSEPLSLGALYPGAASSFGVVFWKLGSDSKGRLCS